ncbi:MAG: NAD(P)-dependent oxidoreductase [Solirubrobacteraceae bacterium]|nr:NAD(P)-dependent oxidoreductase [Solirubrobacteraceae bacterium]
MPGPRPVTVLGLGPMGAALARAFLAAGHPTTVWNRTASKAAPLVARGARAAATPAEAAAAGPLTVVCVIDDAAARSVLEPAAGALAGRTVVNLTADTPQRARATAAWAAERGIAYLGGALMTPVETIGGPDAAILYSGPREAFAEHAPTLAALGGTADHVGADPGRAAAFEVALLDLFWTSMSGLVHAFALADAEGVAARDLAPCAQGVAALLGPIADEFAGHLEAGRHDGDTSTLASALAGIEHVAEASAARGLDTGVIDAARRMARRGVDAGAGRESFSSLTRELLAAAGRAAAA